MIPVSYTHLIEHTFARKERYIMKKGNKESKEINYKKEGNKLWAGIESEETDKRIYEFIERLYLQEKAGV